jgi:hypothetical protein
MVPIAPNGSRRNILVSIHVNFQSPRSMEYQASIANRVTGQFEEDILKVGENRAEIGDPYPILGQTVNDFGDKILAAAPNREMRRTARDRVDSGDCSKTLRSASVVCGEDDTSLRAMPLNPSTP